MNGTEYLRRGGVVSDEAYLEAERKNHERLAIRDARTVYEEAKQVGASHDDALDAVHHSLGATVCALFEESLR